MVETKQFKVDNVKIRVKDERARADIASDFSERTSYAVGDMAIYGGYLYKFKFAHPAGAWRTADVTQITICGELKKCLPLSGGETSGTITAQTGSGTSYIAGAGGSQAGIYVKKGELNEDQFIPGITIQTKSGGGWAIGNYDDESLQFVYGTKANIDTDTDTTANYTIDTNGNYSGNAANVTGTVAIDNGGTGATTAADARTNLEITPENIGASASDHTHDYLPLDGGTMTGQLFTSFKSSVAMGSYQSSQTTIPNLVGELRYSSGCAGSANIGSAYSLNGVTVGAGWYNFFYSPHRSGGVNGAASGDNASWGTLLLCGMTVSGMFQIRVSNGGIGECLNVNGLYSSSDLAHGSSTLASGQVYYVYV